MTSIQFTDADRDDRGFVKAPAPDSRSLADLLPSAAPTPTRRPITRQELISAAIFVPLLISALLYLSRGDTAAPAAPAAASAVPTAAPLPSAPPVEMLPAFAEPGGARLGSIEATRAIAPAAHFGSDWIQADVAGSGLVWLRAADFPSLAIVGPDLAPRPTAPPLPQAPAATAPPPPPLCAEVGIPGKIVRVCGYDDLANLEAQAKQQWLEQFGGNLGVISTPSPQVREP